MPDRAPTVELVRRSPVFANLGDAVVARLLRTAFAQLLPRGAVMFEQHEQADFLHLLLEGSVALQARDERGQETVVEIFRAGELFLVPAAVLRLPYLASGAALTDVRVLMLPAEAFRSAMAEDAAVARAAVELLSRHWRLMVDQVVDLKLRAAEQRLARFLARRVPESEGAGVVELAEARAAIAARLGMTPETLSRGLAALEAKGLIRVHARHVDVVDRDRLVNHARGGGKRP